MALGSRWRLTAKGGSMRASRPRALRAVSTVMLGVIAFTRSDAPAAPIAAQPRAVQSPRQTSRKQRPRPKTIQADRGLSTSDPQANGKEWQHREVPVDPPAPAETLRQRVTQAVAPIVRDGFVSVQVNVDELGNNIVGDAANEPSIAIDPTDPNRIAIGWRQFDTVANSFRQAGVAYSQDAGQSWTFPDVLDRGQFRSDPVLGSDAEGIFYYSSLSSLASIEVFRSFDGGVTWGQPVPAFGGDKQWIAVDQTLGIGRGHLYQIWNVQFTCCPPGDFTRSIDSGVSFEAPAALPAPRMKWGTMDVGPDGTLFLAGSELNTDNGQLFTRSLSAQDAFSPPTFEPVMPIDLGGTTSFGRGPNPAGLTGQVWIATDHSTGPSRGNIYVLGSVNVPGLDPLDVTLIRSTDGGATWSAPVRINDDPTNNGAWQWFGTLSVAPNGRIDAAWNDTRNDPANLLSEVFHAFSLDGGRTWSDNVPISPPFDSRDGWPQQNKLGDYYHMLSDTGGANLAYAATFNAEQDVYFVRIPADCNGNGLPDDVDAVNDPAGDCNWNLIPDECERDCDGNQVADACDILAGRLEDTDQDGIPDICDGAIMSLRPVSADGPHVIDGNEIRVQAGLVVTLEVHLGNWDGDGDGSPRLQAWQVVLDQSGFSSGSQGVLAGFKPPCTVDTECVAALGGACSLTGVTCSARSDCPFGDLESCVGSICGSDGSCESTFVLSARSDYVFADVGNLVSLSAIDYRVGGVVTGAAVADPGELRYAASFVLAVPLNARGVFSLGLRPPPLAVLVDELNVFIEDLSLLPARIVVTQPICGSVNDCSGHGACIGPDLCLCDEGWSGSDCGTVSCAALQDCSGHGVCASPNECVCDPGWAAADCSFAVAGKIALVPTDATGPHFFLDNEIVVEAGATVSLEVRLSDWDRDGNLSPRLSAWRVQLDASGYTSAASGELVLFTASCATDADCSGTVGGGSECGSGGRCTAAFIDRARPDYVFAGLADVASVDQSTSDFIYEASVALDAPVDPGISTYAGTLTLQVSSDARGSFTLGFQRDLANAPLLDESGTALVPLDFVDARITIVRPDLFTPKNRFISVGADQPGHPGAISVSMTSLSGSFGDFNGTSMWFGPPTRLSEATNLGIGTPPEPGDQFIWVSRLQCDSFSTDWSQFGGPIHGYHEFVVPGSVYSVEFVADPPGTAPAGLPPSGPFDVSTAMWADVTGGFDDGLQLWTGADGVVGIVDVVAILDAFSGLPTAPVKARWDLEAVGTGLIEGRINITEAVLVLDAFAGRPYPFAPTSAPCP